MYMVVTSMSSVVTTRFSTYLVKWLAVETIAGRYIRPKPTPVMILESISVRIT